MEDLAGLGAEGSEPEEEEEPIIHVWKVAGNDAGRSGFRLGGVLRTIAHGHFHSLALMADGRVLSWGRGALGLLGHGNEEDVRTPKPVEALGNSVLVVSCGPYHSAVITDDGVLRTFGWLFRVSSRGVVEQSFSLLPEPALGFPRGLKVVGVACGCYATAAWAGTGQLFTWGRGSSGQLGHGTFDDEPLPKRVEALEGVRVVQAVYGGVQSNLEHSGFLIARSASGKVYSCGMPKRGRLGRETAPSLEASGALAHHSLPGQIKLSNGASLLASGVSASDNHAAAVTPQGKAYVWGVHESGRLGPDVSADAPTPTLIDVLSDDKVVAIACSAVSTMALTADGELVLLSATTPPDTSVTTEFDAVHTLHTADPVVALYGGGYFFAAAESPEKAQTARAAQLPVLAPKPVAELAPLHPATQAALAAVPPELAEILQADVKGLPPNQLRQELRLLRDLLKAERGRLRGAASAYTFEKSSTPLTPLDKFFGGQFEHPWQDPKPYDWPHKPSITIVDQPTPKPAPPPKPRPTGHEVYRASTSLLFYKDSRLSTVP